MQDLNTASSKILFVTSYEEKIPSSTPYSSIVESFNSPAMSIQYFDSPLNSKLQQ